MPKQILYEDVIDLWITSDVTKISLNIYSFCVSKHGESSFSDGKLRINISRFNAEMTKKWRQSQYKKERLLENHSAWLKWTKFKETNSDNEPSTSAGKRGRPEINFETASEKTKLRRVENLLNDYCPEELAYAAKKSKKRSKEKQTETTKKLEPSEALSLCFDLGLSDEKYKILANVVNRLHENCFPSLYSIRKLRRTLTPKIKVTEISAEVDLQPLMRMTTNGILEQCRNGRPSGKLALISKWGMDGSSGHSLYKQKFAIEEHTDEFLFVVAFVPLKLIDSSTNEALWENSTPSSTLSCRPIKFVFTKESKQIVSMENNNMNFKINNLECDTFLKNGEVAEVSYIMHCTMIDGSVANVLTENTSASRCFICKASPKEMNLVTTSRLSNEDHYKFGLSILHCWIRFLECLIHIAYRLPFKKWQVRNENKEIYLENKYRIQRVFKEEMGLIIDQVKQGYGTTNDGNTARKFFSNVDTAARITKLDKDLLYNMSLILKVLSCGKTINIKEFDLLLLRTRDLYLKNYSWYYMPSSLHKVLIHGTEVIKYFDLPIGSLSEEALESTHKIIRNARLSHTRKTSRENTNEDLMRFLILSSDPGIVSKRNLISKVQKRNDNCIAKYLVEINMEGTGELDNFAEMLNDAEESSSDESYIFD